MSTSEGFRCTAAGYSGTGEKIGTGDVGGSLIGEEVSGRGGTLPMWKSNMVASLSSLISMGGLFLSVMSASRSVVSFIVHNYSETLLFISSYVCFVQQITKSQFNIPPFK